MQRVQKHYQIRLHHFSHDWFKIHSSQRISSRQASDLTKEKEGCDHLSLCTALIALTGLVAKKKTSAAPLKVRSLTSRKYEIELQINCCPRSETQASGLSLSVKKSYKIPQKLVSSNHRDEIIV